MTLWNDFRYAARQLRKNRAFTITVLATLALCIGVNTAIYTIVDTLFFRSLPYPNPDRLVLLTTVSRKEGALNIDTSQTGRMWEIVRDRASFLDSTVYGMTDGVNLFASGRVEYVKQQRIGPDFFGVLGIQPLIGREFTRQEDVPRGPALTVLSYGLWQRLFRGDRSIVGRTVDLRGAPYTVVGVMPEGFHTIGYPLGEAADLWTPLQPSTAGEGSGDNYGMIARLKPGVTLAQADGQLNSILRSVYEDMSRQYGISAGEKAMPLQTGLTTDIRSRIDLMWGAVLLVLFIGCVNIAGILLARSATRSREIATRMAIGAGRARVISQLLSEAVLLAFVGGLLGLLVGQLALLGLTRLNPQLFDAWGPVHLDFRVMSIMLAISVATGILFGLFPAFEATSVDLRAALSEGGRGASGGRRQWQRQALVVAEVALGFVLVAAAGLLIRSFAKLMNLNPGFNPNHVITASLSLHDARYSTTGAGARLFRESLDRIRQIPGVESAAVALRAPYERPLNMGIQQISGETAKQVIGFTYVTPGFFHTLEIPLLRGRGFTDADNATAARVATANKAFISRYLPNRADPLGTEITIAGVGYRIVGIVAGVQQRNSMGRAYGPIAPLPQIYVPVSQFPNGLFALANTWFSPSWIVRTHGEIAGLSDAMRRALEAVDPRLPFSSFQSMAQLQGDSLEQQRYEAVLFSTFAGLAILLAALGVYGLVAQSVAQRTREMGIRLALGATTENIVRAAATPGILLSVAGIGAGLILAIFAARLLKSLIWGVSATDPVTFVIVILLLIAVAGLSSIVPALRLARLDPAQTLRDE